MPNDIPVDPHTRFDSVAFRARGRNIRNVPRAPAPTVEESRAAALGPWLSMQECEQTLLPYLCEQVRLANVRSRQSVGQSDAVHYFECGNEAAFRDMLDQIRAWRSGHTLEEPDSVSEE